MDLLTDCSGVDLDTLEYPRHLHKGEQAYLRVNSAEEAAAAKADGWRVDLLIPDGEAAPEIAPATPTEPAKKAGRKKKATA